MENEELQELKNILNSASMVTTPSDNGAGVTVSLVDQDGSVLVNTTDSGFDFEFYAWAVDLVPGQGTLASVWEFPFVGPSESFSFSYDLDTEEYTDVGYPVFNNEDGIPKDAKVSIDLHLYDYDFYDIESSWSHEYYILNGSTITRQGIIDEYTSLLDVTITDNTEYPSLVCEESTMHISTKDIDVSYSLSGDLPYGDIILKYNAYANFGSVLHIGTTIDSPYDEISSIMLNLGSVEIPQPEIVSNNLSVNIEVLSKGLFMLGSHGFFELDASGQPPVGDASVDLEISGGQAPYTYSVSLYDPLYITYASFDEHTNATTNGTIELRGIPGTSNIEDDLSGYSYHPLYNLSITDSTGCTLYKSFNVPYKYEEASLSSEKLTNEIFLDEYTDGLSNGVVSVTANTDAPAVLEFKKETDPEWKTVHTFQLGNEDSVTLSKEGLDAGMYELRLRFTEDGDGGYSISSQVEVMKEEASNSCQLLIDYIMNEQIAILQARLDAVEARADQSGRIVESNNFALGEGTLENADSTTDYNFAFGRNTLHNLEGGDKNISIGNRSQYNNVTGNDNISIGNGALDNVVDGEGNIAIGKNAGNWGGNSSNKLSIGTGAPLIGGDFKTREITLDGKTLSFLSTPSGVQFVAWE